MQALVDASAGMQQMIDEVEEHAVDELGRASGIYGHAGLARSMAAFAQRGQHWVEQLTRDATDLSQALAESAQTYAETENLNLAQFRGE